MHRLLPWQKSHQVLAAHQLLWRISNYQQRALKKTLHQHGITYIEYAIVTELLAQRHTMTSSYQQIADALHMNRRTIAKAMERAWSKRLVRYRMRDLFDRRAWSIQASPIGANIVYAIDAQTLQIEQELVHFLGSDSLKRLEQLHDNIHNTHPQPKAKAFWWRATHAPRR